MDTGETHEAHEIRPIGGYMPMDTEGYVLREASMTAPGVQMVLATQSLCVHGHDVIPAITTRYRPGPAMVLNLPWLASELDAFEALTARGAGADAIRGQCRALMKVMIRAGFELVMAAEQRYTTSLYWCHRSFARHHPDQAAAMERALSLYLSPSSDAGAVLALARGLGTWLLAAAGR